MAYLHQIDTNEMDTRLAVPVSGTAGLQVVVGTAPVNMVKEPEKAVNHPIIAYNYGEAASQLGYCSDFENYTLCQSISANFKVFSIRPVIFINVLDPGKHKKDYTGEEIPVISKMAHINEYGIMMKGLVVSVSSETGQIQLERDVDYIAEFDAAGELDITLLSTEKTNSITSVKVTGSQLDVSKITKEDIIGGYNAVTGEESGIELVRQIYPRFGMVPGLILAPGWSKEPEVAAALAAKTEGLNGVFTCECAADM